MNRKYHDETEAYFVSIGLMPPKEERTERWVLHHPDEEMIRRDPERHDKYLIEDVVPMPLSEHSHIHCIGENGCFSKVDQKGEHNGFYGHHHSEETKRKIGERKAFLGHHHSEETKEKMRLNHNSPGMTGKTHTEETKKKMSESAKNRAPRRWKLIDGKRIYY